MMYIRTKDGVYLVDEERETYFIKLSKNGFENYVPREKVIKQSENLEELCDEIVDENQHYILKNKNLLKDIPNKSALKNHKMYGAIWTDKGLIYVAKMNENGELELL